MFEMLFAEDSQYKLAPMLADSHTISPDGKTYTITLRKGIPFHNGAEMKADDVVASLNRWGAMSALIGQPTFKTVLSVTATDDYTVSISLKEPSGSLLSALASPIQGAFIMPKSIVDQFDGKPLKDFIGTGPYMLKEFIPQQRATLVRFPKYTARAEPPSGYAGRRSAYLDTISIIPVTEDAARLAGIEAGDYDLADFLPNDEYDRVSANPKLATYLWKPASGQARTILNTRSPVLNDLRIRQAIKLAVPPQAVMEAFGPSIFWRINPSLINEGMAYYSDAGKDVYLGYDPDKARQLMKDASYNGQTLRFLTTKATDYYYTMSEVVADYLRKVGFNVDVSVRDWSTYLQMRDKETDSWDLAGSGTTFRSDPSQVSMISCTGFAGWWCTDERMQRVSTMNSLTDYTERYAAWENVQTLYWQDLPSIKWGDILQYRAAAKSVHSEANLLEQVLLVLWNTWRE
jgi:peptide/nickel transport system substrate-binding protein